MRRSNTSHSIPFACSFSSIGTGSPRFIMFGPMTTSSLSTSLRFISSSVCRCQPCLLSLQAYAHGSMYIPTFIAPWYILQNNLFISCLRSSCDFFYISYHHFPRDSISAGRIFHAKSCLADLLDDQKTACMFSFLFCSHAGHVSRAVPRAPAVRFIL